MGMPLSNFAVMHALAAGGDDWLAREAREALAPFNLFAFVVHSPDEHRRFHHELDQAFWRLDHSTGHELLFFALLDAPREWVHEAHRKREYFASIRKWETVRLLEGQVHGREESGGIGAQALVIALGVPEAAVPCLVITGGFGRTDSMWVRTCETHIERQLNTLGLWASRYGRSAFEHARRETQEIDLCGGAGPLELTEQLAAVLADVLAAHSIGRGPRTVDPHTRSLALERARVALQRLANRVAELKSRGSVFEEVERLHVLTGSLLALANSAVMGCHGELPAHFDELHGVLAPASYTFLRTAVRAKRALSGEDGGGARELLRHGDDLDFSPAVVCYAKTLESEINLSLVQLARTRLGIEMPEYFTKFHPGVRAVVMPRLPNPRPIDLNRCGRGRHWLPPGLGESRLACEAVLAGQEPPFWPSLQAPWRALVDSRNQAAHATVLAGDAAEEAERQIASIARARGFEELASVRRALAGNPHA